MNTKLISLLALLAVPAFAHGAATPTATPTPIVKTESTATPPAAKEAVVAPKKDAKVKTTKVAKPVTPKGRKAAPAK